MKARGNRTHLSGSSNRNPQPYHLEQTLQHTLFNKNSQRFEKSYAKSQSLNYKTAPLNQTSKDVMKEFTYQPNIGQHHQFDTTRFNVNNIRPYKPHKNKIPLTHTLKLKDQINSKYQHIKENFKGKNINMHKLNQLKLAFLTNCTQKRNLKETFKKYKNNEQLVDSKGIKKIVKDYGFDVNDDQADFIIQLTQPNSKSLNINSFINLMTRQNVYFSTISFDRKQFQKSQFFSPKIHQILRNKFFQLRQAFRIYTTRGQSIDRSKFQYVLKKLDINSLVITQEQKQFIFNKFKDESSNFNPQALICNIANQQNARIKVNRHQSFDFGDQIKVNEQKNYQNKNKIKQQSLKNLSNLQYQLKLAKANLILKQLRLINNKKNIFNEIMNCPQMGRKQIVENVERILQSQGFNFQKHQYDAFLAYLDFNKEGKISKQLGKKLILEQSEQSAWQRLDRKVRNPPPVFGEIQSNGFDQSSAKVSLKKINDYKNNPQIKQLFSQMDSDRDGYISKKQLGNNISKMNILQNWQINNLVNYMDRQNKGYLNYQKFASIFSQAQKQQFPMVNEPKIKSQSCSQWTNTKKKFINTNNKYVYNAPSKYSAWPQHLRESDLSLIQPPPKSGIYISETQRFNKDTKHEVGAESKKIGQKKYQNKLRKLAQWQNKVDTNIKAFVKRQQEKQLSRNYFLRLGKQIYQENCHKGPQL